MSKKTWREILERQATLQQRREEKERRLLEKLKPQREKQLQKIAREPKGRSEEPKRSDALNFRLPGSFGAGKRR